MENKLSQLCLIMGFLSIIGSILIWATTKGVTNESVAHAERFGVFVGLWAPTFFALSIKLTHREHRAAELHATS